ncbi:hypothetical protein F0562_010751 [Nyssa sinensis]|uniref:Uncharacterized protein n=1 Tax=Nyssa sinensis TaxID=561372 RepID=A0A5J5A2V5_9ASTE|nr:hypothetical protein F0562_010751 [Nyssa sinensis]
MVLALHIEARESKFFTKVTRDSSKSPTNNVNKISEPPLLAPAPAPAVAEPLKEYGYGLYGHESSEFPPTKTTTTTTTISDFENEIPTETLGSTKSYKEYNTGDAYNNNGYSNNNYYNNNGYSNYNNNNNNGYTTNNYNNNGYATEKKGMSDTRFLENGKYFYNVKTENYNGNGYESVKENGNNERYYGNNNENTYEFDTMEEYERQQGYPESQEGLRKLDLLTVEQNWGLDLELDGS